MLDKKSVLNDELKQVLQGNTFGVHSPNPADTRFIGYCVGIRHCIVTGVLSRSVNLANSLACAVFLFQAEELNATISFAWSKPLEKHYRYAKRKTSARILRDVVENSKQPCGLNVRIRLVLDTR